MYHCFGVFSVIATVACTNAFVFQRLFEMKQMQRQGRYESIQCFAIVFVHCTIVFRVPFKIAQLLFFFVQLDLLLVLSLFVQLFFQFLFFHFMFILFIFRCIFKHQTHRTCHRFQQHHGCTKVQIADVLCTDLNQQCILF